MEPKAAKDGNKTSQQSSPKVVYLRSEAAPDLADNFDSLGYVKSALASKYEIIDRIARTETSSIFRAVHVQLGREVALRVLLRSIAQDRGYVDMFHRRSRAIDKLSQSNIIRIYDEGVESGLHYVAMEYLKGITLDERVSEQGPLPFEIMLGLMMPAVSGLRHAHHNSIVHGNINCSSIFLHNDGRIVLNGFGVQSGQVNSRPLFKRGESSIEYVSPEEAAGNGADTKTDIYSLGVVMYHALTGRFPYSEESPEATAQAILSGIYMPVSDYIEIPQWLESVINRCLQSDPSRRIQSCAELMVLFNASSTIDSESFSIPDMSEDTTVWAEPQTSEIPDEKESPGSPEDTAQSVEPAPPDPQPPGRTDSPVPKMELPGIVKHEARADRSPVEARAVKQQTVRLKKGRGHFLAWSLSAAALILIGAGTALMMYAARATTSSPRVTPKETLPTAAQAQQKKAPAENADQETREPASGLAEHTGQMSTGESGKQNIDAIPVKASTPKAEYRRGVRSRSVKQTATTKATQAREKNTSAASVKRTAPKPDAAPAVRQIATQARTDAGMVTLPDLTGIQLGVANTILTINGLVLGRTSVIQAPGKEDLVIQQSPRAGSRLKKGSAVDLILGAR